MKRQDIVLAVIVAIATLFFIYHASIANALAALKLTHQQEPFTELYLNDVMKLSQSLPNTVEAGSTIAFSFTIHNEEGKDTAYPYLVYVVGDTMATTTIDESDIVLASNASTSIAESYTFNAPHKQVSVFIVLTERNQSVHFFLPARE